MTTSTISLPDLLHQHWLSDDRTYPNALADMGRDLLRSDVLVMTVIYIVLQPILRVFVLGKDGQVYKNNKPFWKSVMYAYNLIMSFFSLGCFLLAAHTLTKYPTLSENCTAMVDDPIFSKVVYAFYISKFVEYADTFFLILRGVPVTYLQWYHHIGAAVSLWVPVNYNGEPIWIFVLLNGGIHTIMYMYYAQSVYGRKLLPKPLITSLQILQFFTGFYLLYGYKDVECYRRRPKSFIGVWYYNYVYVGLLLPLFFNFFLVNYVCRSGKKVQRSKAVKAA